MTKKKTVNSKIILRFPHFTIPPNPCTSDKKYNPEQQKKTDFKRSAPQGFGMPNDYPLTLLLHA